jgi:hypothetical protein
MLKIDCLRFAFQVGQMKSTIFLIHTENQNMRIRVECFFSTVHQYQQRQGSIGLNGNMFQSLVGFKVSPDS